MEGKARQLEVYSDQHGREPFWRWLKRLDRMTRSRIQIQVRKAATGNFGDHKSVGDGVSEMRLHFGPGYRVYYGEQQEYVVVLFGGDKSTQTQDIETAKQYWRDWRENNA